MKTTKIYNYSSKTGEYTGADVARESPMEPGAYLIPAFATTVKPPKSKSGFVPVFDGEKWQLVENHRGKTAYSTSDAQPLEIEAIGPVPEGYTLTARPDVDHKWNGKEWKLDEAARAERLADAARAHRRNLLAATDYQAVMAYETGGKVPAAVKKYRQALRDVTQQPGFPENIEWPKKPKGHGV